MSADVVVAQRSVDGRFVQSLDALTTAVLLSNDCRIDQDGSGWIVALPEDIIEHHPGGNYSTIFFPSNDAIHCLKIGSVYQLHSI